MELLICQREVWIVEFPKHDLTILLLFKFRGIREYTHWRPQAQKKTEHMTFNFKLTKAYSLFATNKILRCLRNNIQTILK